MKRSGWGAIGWVAVSTWMSVGGGAGGGPLVAAAPISKCAPSLCVDTVDAMWAWEPSQVPLSQTATATWNPSLAAGFTRPRLVAATDQAGNVVQRCFTDYTNAFQGAGDSGNIYNFTQWPYLGLFYYYNHAAMAVPPTGWINAAHRNGVPIVGVMTGDCDGCADADNEFYADPEKAATRLALIANTYGFDGWLIDVENGVDLDLAKAVMTALRPKPGPGGRPLIVLYYEAGVNDLSSVEAQQAFNAAGYFQSDYGPGSPAATNAFVVKNPAPNNNPFTTSYSRYVYQFNSDGSCPSGPKQIHNGSACLDTQNLFGALAAIRKSPGIYYQAPSLYAIGWERWAGPDLNFAATRAQVQQAHRDLFVGYGASVSGPTCKPTPLAVNSVAAFVDAAGLTLTSPFVTRFNAGEGDSFAIQGIAASPTPWNGLGLQDVQPTWICLPVAGVSAQISYTAAYDGGSSLALNGTGDVRLYETNLATPASPIAVVRYQGAKPPLGLVLDSTNTWRRAKETSSSNAGNWVTSVQAFTGISGAIRAIGVTNQGAPVVLGELGIMGSQDFTPTRPPAIQSKAAPDAGDLTWDWDDPTAIWYANVFGCSAPGAEPVFLGRAFQPAFDPGYTIEPRPKRYPRYIIQPVARSGVASVAFSCR